MASSHKSSYTRVIVYIDGFNLYYGLRQANFKRYYWLNLKLLSENLLKAGQQLQRVKYFTAKIKSFRGNQNKPKRQHKFLEALRTLSDFDIHYGHFLSKTIRCKKCGASWNTSEEKMSDVNLSVTLLEDAFLDRFDTALVVSGDSDLSTPIERVMARFSDKQVVVAFPPKRWSDQLRKKATANLRIGRKKLKDSQFPDEVYTNEGKIVKRPSRWQ